MSCALRSPTPAVRPVVQIKNASKKESVEESYAAYNPGRDWASIEGSLAQIAKRKWSLSRMSLGATMSERWAGHKFRATGQHGDAPTAIRLLIERE
jgi:hypothetical protein